MATTDTKQLSALMERQLSVLSALNVYRAPQRLRNKGHLFVAADHVVTKVATFTTNANGKSDKILRESETTCTVRDFSDGSRETSVASSSLMELRIALQY